MTVANNILYLGGYFTYLSRSPRAYNAALDLSTGNITGWNPSLNRNVNSIVVNGSVAYLAGTFAGNQSRNHLAAVMPNTGQPTAWNPNPDVNIDVLSIQGNVLAGLADPARAVPVLLHPNPTNGLFTVALPREVSQAAFTVFNVCGREVICTVTKGTAGTSLWQQFDLRPNSTGLYLIKIQPPKAVVIKRVFLSR